MSFIIKKRSATDAEIQQREEDKRIAILKEAESRQREFLDALVCNNQPDVIIPDEISDFERGPVLADQSPPLELRRQRLQELQIASLSDKLIKTIPLMRYYKVHKCRNHSQTSPTDLVYQELWLAPASPIDCKGLVDFCLCDPLPNSSSGTCFIQRSGENSTVFKVTREKLALIRQAVDKIWFP